MKYMLFYLCLVILIFFGLRWYKQRYYSPEKLEEMIVAVSALRDKTDDPCKYSLLGDPVSAKLEYIKVNLYCDKESKTINSMDLRAIKDRTVGGAIRELARVNGFEVNIDKEKFSMGTKDETKWKCLQDNVPVTDFETQLIQRATIECFNGFSKGEMLQFYEKK